MLPVTAAAAGWTTAAAFGNPSKSMNGSTRRGFLSLMMSQSNGLFTDNVGPKNRYSRATKKLPFEVELDR